MPKLIFQLNLIVGNSLDESIKVVLHWPQPCLIDCAEEEQNYDAPVSFSTLGLRITGAFYELWMGKAKAGRDRNVTVFLSCEFMQDSLIEYGSKHWWILNHFHRFIFLSGGLLSITDLLWWNYFRCPFIEEFRCQGWLQYNTIRAVVDWGLCSNTPQWDRCSLSQQTLSMLAILAPNHPSHTPQKTFSDDTCT